MSRNRLRRMAGALLLIAAALAWYGFARTTESSSDKQTAETFIRGVLLAQYTRPVLSEAEARLTQAYSNADAELSQELSRILTELRNDKSAMESMKATYRDSSVRIRFRSLEVKGSEAAGVVEVLADWYWGYDGKPTEKPSQTYNLHEIRLIRSGDGWQIALDRNLASSPKTQVQVRAEKWPD